MGPVSQLFKDKAIAFDTRTTRVIGQAFDLACENLRQDSQPEVVKEIIAKRIIEEATKGERDPYRLAAKAMNALGIHLS